MIESVFDGLSDGAHAFARHLLGGVGLGVLVTLLVGGVLRVLRPANAATRFLVWWLALALVVALAVLPWQAERGTQRGAQRDTIAASAATSEIESADQPPADQRSVAAPIDQVDVASLRSHAIDAPTPSRTPGTRPSSLSMRLAGLLPLFVCALVAGGAAFLLVRLLLVLRRVRRIVTGGIEPPARCSIDMAELSRQMGLRRPARLLICDAIELPMATALGGPTVLLPASLVATLADREWRDVVLHELAHLRRHDAWLRPLQTSLRALLWFHPAVHWISRQLDLECEIACDDRVVSVTGAPTAYARCLARLAELCVGRQEMLVPGMSLGRKQILRRFDDLLRPGRGGRTRVRRGYVIGVGAALLVAVVVSIQLVPTVALPFEPVHLADLRAAARSEAPVDPLPAPPIVQSAADSPRPIDWTEEHNNLDLSLTLMTPDGSEPMYTIWQTGDVDLRVATLGEVLFTLDGLDVAGLDDDGFLAVIDRRAGVEREIDLRAGANGSLVYDYRVGGQRVALDDEGRLWLGSVCSVLVGAIEDGADQRARAILTRDGVDGLLREVPRLSCERNRHLYLGVAIEEGDLGQRELIEALELIESRFENTSRQGALLVELAPELRDHRALLPRLGEVLATIDDGFERNRVLRAVLDGAETDTDLMLTVFGMAPELLADRARYKMVTELVHACVDDDERWAACRELALGIDERYYRREALDNMRQTARLLGSERYRDPALAP